MLPTSQPYCSCTSMGHAVWHKACILRVFLTTPTKSHLQPTICPAVATMTVFLMPQLCRVEGLQVSRGIKDMQERTNASNDFSLALREAACNQDSSTPPNPIRQNLNVKNCQIQSQPQGAHSVQRHNPTQCWEESGWGNHVGYALVE